MAGESDDGTVEEDERRQSERRKDGSDILPSNEDAVLPCDPTADLFVPNLPPKICTNADRYGSPGRPIEIGPSRFAPPHNTNVHQIKSKPLDDTLSAYSDDSSTDSLPPSRFDHGIQSSLVEKSVAERSRTSEKAYKRRVPRNYVPFLPTNKEHIVQMRPNGGAWEAIRHSRPDWVAAELPTRLHGHSYRRGGVMSLLRWRRRSRGGFRERL